jgi:hypothetical protein
MGQSMDPGRDQGVDPGVDKGASRGMPESGSCATVFDPVRKRHVAATPEEGVRQAVLRYLLDVLRVPANLIGVEFSLASLEPGNLRRADIVVWRPGAGQLTPWLLVECKAPRVAAT